MLRFEDLERFEALIATRSTEQAIADYLEAASAGLAAYLRTYRVTPAAYAERLAERPLFYRALVGLRDRLRPFEPGILQAMARVRALLPGTPDAPVFFLVGTLGPGATPREVRSGTDAASLGILMPVEHVGMTAETDMSEFPEGRAGRAQIEDVVGFVAHEYGHVAQVHRQGLEQYRRLYTVPGRATNLAMAVREGGAELVSWLTTAQLRERHRYFQRHADELRREFIAIASHPAAQSRGWFSGRNEDRPDRPAQLGYAVGLDMCRRFFDMSGDRSAALLAIVSATEPEDFDVIARPYLNT
ncbi:hypothetical protein RCO27_01365 [Sphingosinicella sp. LHD-64]|uniref:hypothetical protein n=1 Tax=Sphingosinicella sp. LHD-64 TaxID=3072139 RepID=UPI00280D7AA7|nr:hypothetical protein [Sphingosinicella sp. LHD-64]MDQ8754865.1 hypothetical protein [Sphingosinicella sp. LHD-64]